MSLHKAAAVVSDRGFAHALGGALQDLVWPAPVALTVFEEPAGWRVEAYFSEAPSLDGVERQLSEALGRPAPRLAAEPVPDLNWVAISQAALPPVRAGRFRVHGSHDRGRVARGPGAILIDAGEAFGTAHHATTFGCLLALGQITRRRAYRRVLDLGCGSGVLAIAAARAGPKARVTASDLDLRSVEVARENIRLNGLASRIRVYRAEGLSHAGLRGRSFDLAVAHILAAPLSAMARDIARAVEPGGTLVLSGLLTPQAPVIIARYRAFGFAVERHGRVFGWSTLTLARRGHRPAS